MNNQAIRSIDIKNFWGKYHFHWDLHPDVNILIGINGSGKSTVLNIVENLILNLHVIGDINIKIDVNFKDGYWIKVNRPFDEKHYNLIREFSPRLLSKISTFDVPVTDKDDLTETDTFLDLELERVIYQRKNEALNFTNYRLNLTDTNNSEEEILRINRRIRSFFDLINDFFEKTDKNISIDNQSKALIFKTKDNQTIQLNQLSSGEKQLLIILFKVFLQDEKPYILLMDEPELSLHVTWQRKLIKTLRTLNPNCQLIIATHSGSIFAEGWEEKRFWMEDLMKPQ